MKNKIKRYLINICLMILFIMLFTIPGSAANLGKVSKVTVKSVSSKEIAVSWSKVSGAEGYEISISEHEKEGYVKLGIMYADKYSATEASITGLTYGVNYYVKIRAFSGNKFGAFSDPVSGKTAVQPVDDFGFGMKNGAVTLYWPMNMDASGYEIYRSSSKDGTYKLVKKITSGKTNSFKDTTTKKGKTYYYKIRAYKKLSGDKIGYSKYTAKKKIAVPKTDKSVFVAANKLQRYNSLKSGCTNTEFNKAYEAAKKIVKPLFGMSRKNQLYYIASAIRERFDSGKVKYSTSKKHYSDPYGYFITGYGSCAGCTRATGLCLNMLGIKYEHVNENKWTHQWCRVKVGSEYWICDAYGLYVGPEPAPRKHPTL